jgi:hypothetical protein
MGSTTKWLKENDLWNDLKVISEDLVDEMLSFFKSPSTDIFQNLIKKISIHRNIFKNSPKFPKHLGSFLESLEGFDTHWTYKTTGAGGEDAVLLLGTKENIETVVESVTELGWTLFEGSFSELGAHVVIED